MTFFRMSTKRKDLSSNNGHFKSISKNIHKYIKTSWGRRKKIRKKLLLTIKWSIEKYKLKVKT